MNHLEGHVHAVFLEAHRTEREAKFPAVCLIVSGGHTVLYEVTAARSKSIEIPSAKNRPDVSFESRRLSRRVRNLLLPTFGRSR